MQSGNHFLAGVAALFETDATDKIEIELLRGELLLGGGDDVGQARLDVRALPLGFCRQAPALREQGFGMRRQHRFRAYAQLASGQSRQANMHSFSLVSTLPWRDIAVDTAQSESRQLAGSRVDLYLAAQHKQRQAG